MNNNALNEVKVTGTVVSKVIKSELKDNKFICSFIFKLDDRGIHVPVKFVGNRPVEFDKNDHLWLKASLAAIKNFKGEYELGLNASAYKVHTNDNNKPIKRQKRNYQVNQELIDSVNDVFNNTNLDNLD